MKALFSFARYLLVGTWFFALSLLAFLVCLVRPFDPRNNALFRRWCLPRARRWLGIELQVRHRERLAGAGPAVFITNHQHTLDVFVFGNLLPDRTITIGKRSLGLIPLFGWMYYLSGNLLINRRNHASSMRTMERAREMVLRGTSVMLAPEGTRSGKKGLGPFKKGAFHLAVDAQAPIQPLVASSYYKSVDFSRPRAGLVLADVLEPIPTTGMRDTDVPALMAEAHRRMERAIAALDAELDANHQQ